MICSNIIVWIHHCFGKALEIAAESRTLLPNEEVYYEYVPGKLQWHAVHRLCKQRSSTLAVITSVEEHQELTNFLQSLNISQPVWIEKIIVPEISGINGQLTQQFIVPWLNASLQYHNFSLEDSWIQNNDTCVMFDPTNGKWGWDYCKAQRGGVCQIQNEHLDNLGFPNTPLFTQAINRSYYNPELEENNSTFFPENELIWLSFFSQSIVRVIETSPDIITPSDLLYLIQTIELAAAAQTNKTAFSSEVLKTMATNYLNLASSIIDPILVRQWLDLKPLGIHLRPFMIVESIDKLLWALADTIFSERKPFTVSTKNIGKALSVVYVHMEPKKLSQMSCSCVYKPSAQTNHASNQDEILIPETEAQRIYALGGNVPKDFLFFFRLSHKDVMFIHAYYSQLVELLSKIAGDQQTERSPFGHLASAVISVTVRDVSRVENVPVSVQYTLSTVKVVWIIREKYSKLGTPGCIFWNVSMMANHASDWSDKGCRVLYSGSEATSCFCNHTTNFAVLMNYIEVGWSAEEESILTKLTFIGSGASLCALLVTLMLFTVLDIPKSDRTSIHKNLFISLIFAQIVLLCSGSAIHNKVACTLVAALLHLFFMAAFSWMLVEGLLLWSKVVTVNLSEDRHMKYYYMIGWGLPVLIVTITLASASGNYTADGHCWLSVQNGVIWGFAGPVIFIIMVNIMVLTRVVLITISTAKRRSLMLAANTSPVHQVSEQIRAAVKAVLVLLPILGLTWLCGVLVPFSIIMAYIFIVLNSLQGLFIFLIYGMYNTEIQWEEAFQVVADDECHFPFRYATQSRGSKRGEKLRISLAEGVLCAVQMLQCSFVLSSPKNCGSSRPSSSVTSSRQGSSPEPGPLVTHGAGTSRPGSLPAPIAGTNLTCSHGRQIILTFGHGNLKEDPCCLASCIHVTRQEQPLGGVADSCSLHVPMDAELMSCPALSSSRQQHSGLERC
ncbi:hypothetical protein P4O66_013048 [Electrophorus voltai]|uniref:Adhesion G protein-coupled receptor D2 n=1 Tax=Electrophorus voltai TaxID=2609070 RepID=A0AAD8ZV78_9TELE|nr:hypothetical protein P4O66_013048 [Electrophorus voltai]